ncbi:SMC-Scp complex subunit ScpB [Algiphilus sp. W345]|uniref:SMC-Scp complex subunit ScpB n=1 Tax=Banduia mediterranea TaxID=3075609 RepID=A0ABU2WH23_9GAMM|nr:SMC-Scp complex subunit ScpB [Algiphilus sp. W345]MDT0497171.1 SMC-Scp complex subunit ScpB [Algiphilus sp. W345]
MSMEPDEQPFENAPDASPSSSPESDAQVDRILEALLLSADGPMSVDQIQRLIGEELGLLRKDIRASIHRLESQFEGRSVELCEVASGFRIQVRRDYAGWVSRLWQEKPPRFSRALLETLALVCYRQPITRGEIEDVRGVSVSSNILRTLQERGWVREVGVKEVPGRPALFGTTAQFLDDFNLKSLDQLPDLPEIKDSEQLEAALLRLGSVTPQPETRNEGEADEFSPDEPDERMPESEPPADDIDEDRRPANQVH